MSGVNGHLAYAHRVVCQKCKEEQGVVRERVKKIVSNADGRLLAIVTGDQMSGTLQQLKLKPNQYKIVEAAPFESLPTICSGCQVKLTEEAARLKIVVEEGGALCQCPKCGHKQIVDKDHPAAKQAREKVPAPAHVLIKLDCDQCIEMANTPAANDTGDKPSPILTP